MIKVNLYNISTNTLKKLIQIYINEIIEKNT